MLGAPLLAIAIYSTTITGLTLNRLHAEERIRIHTNAAIVEFQDELSSKMGIIAA
jgi:hypothetical protein